jgi:outer membrane lipase/esterase
MHSSTRGLCRALLTAASLGALAACGSDQAVAPATPPLFSTTVAFGSSLDDTGNACNLSAAACPPPPYATGRASNGPLWVELVAQKLGASVIAARSGGTNYAYFGSRTGAIAGTTQVVPNMVQQVDTYLATAPTVYRAQTLFIVDGATVGNDINDALLQGLTNPQAPATIIAGAVANMATIVGKLYAGGARNILLVNSTDIGKTPQVRAAGALASVTATALSTQFNSALAAQVPALRAASAGLNLYVLDLGTITSEIFANPASFSLTNITAPCVVTSPPVSVCTTPDSYFYWDGFHPTAATGRIISQRALTAIGK